MLGKAHRVVGFFLLMLGAGLVLESSARRLGLVLVLLGTALLGRGLWLVRSAAPTHRPTPPATGPVDELGGVVRDDPRDGGLLSTSGQALSQFNPSSVRPEEPPSAGGVSKPVLRPAEGGAGAGDAPARTGGGGS